ncbi:hypothetical protein QVD17_04250 [Tagetes erecta]|uniref:VQ domain-containing protein n=1 Tax=Tagetes erecta TaxID=13708 RepID=A0AAD8LFY4_TARER|nr:hypothetical protein QVD17_04250 [Tagetes erecta]
MDDSNYPKNTNLGVNKISKNIRKTPLPQSNVVDPARSVSQPQVYNINKNDFRSIVQQLTGSPLHHSQQILTPPVNLNHRNTRLQRVRPPPLSPININPPQMPLQTVPHCDNTQVRQDQFGRPQAGWSNAAESPISAYMRHLQHSINDTQSPGLLPNPHGSSPTTPNSQFLLPSPSGYLNLSSPRSPYPLLSPGILGPGPPPPRSPGISFPLSPRFFSVLSPRWRD